MSRDPLVRHLAHQLSAMQDRIRAMEVASQAAFRSIEGGSIDVYDDETDELLGVIGVQKDGSIGVDIKASAKPQTPTEPDVQPIPGGAIVAWDGRFEDRQPWKAIDRIAVHMDETPGFIPDRDTEVGAIMSRHGGTVVIPVDDGAEWYVKLVAVSKGFVWSDPSTEVFVAAVDANVAFYQDEFALTADGAQDLQLTFEPIAFSEHLYWNGLYQREDNSWTREGTVVSLSDTGFAPQNGDVVAVEYAYVEGGLVIPIGATWKYATNLGASATYADPGFDDSSWATAPSPLQAPLYLSPGNVWQRIDGTTTGGDLTFTMDYTDNQVYVYLDGALVYSRTAWASSVPTVTMPCAAGDHVFAVYSVDTDGASGIGQGTGISIKEN